MARRTRCWHVALADEPETPLVEVRFVGSWYLLGWFGRLEVEALAPDGEVGAVVVDETLRMLPSLNGAGLYLDDPPDRWTRARVARILGQLPGRFTALTVYPAVAGAGTGAGKREARPPAGGLGG